MSMSRLKRTSKISPYAARLLKQHIGYIIALVFFVALFMTFIPLQIRQYIALRSQISTLNDEIRELSERRNAIQQYNTDELDELVFLLNSLYPAVEDRFSIYSALDNMQFAHGILITKSSSPFSGKSFNEITIVIDAIADFPTFREFMQNYPFYSGRFITLERVSYNVERQTMTVTTVFHSKKIEYGNKKLTTYDPTVLQRASQIKMEVEAAGLIRQNISDDNQEIPVDYTTKENPFK